MVVGGYAARIIIGTVAFRLSRDWVMHFYKSGAGMAVIDLTPRPPLHPVARGDKHDAGKSPLHWMERGLRGEVNRLALPYL